MLERHRLALVLETDDGAAVVGIVNDGERAVWEKVRVGRTGRPSASALGAGEYESAEAVLDTLHRRRLMMPPTTGYIAVGGSAPRMTEDHEIVHCEWRVHRHSNADSGSGSAGATESDEAKAVSSWTGSWRGCTVRVGRSWPVVVDETVNRGDVIVRDIAGRRRTEIVRVVNI